MPTIITYPSALEFWLTERRNIYDTYPYTQTETLSTQILSSLNFTRAEIDDDLPSLNFKRPVHLAVPRGFARQSNENIVFHSLPKQLPEGSILHMHGAVYIISPELCFLLAACELDFPLLVKLANNLCAMYELTHHNMLGQTNRDPAASVASITKYLQKAQTMTGIKKARRAIKYAVDRSNSPIESELAVIAALPFRYGGYNAGQFVMNCRIDLSKEAAKYYGHDYCICDMVWKKMKVVIEYDSDLFHMTIQKFHKDKKRSSALVASGYQVIHVTSEQLRSFSSVEELFLMVRKALKLPPYPDRLISHYQARVSTVEKTCSLIKNQNWLFKF